MNLYVEYFHFKEEVRQREVFESFDENNKLNCIHNIFAVGDEQNLEYLRKYLDGKQHKVQFIVNPNRCTFQYMFLLSHMYESPDDISCVSNNDIIFTEDFGMMRDKMDENDFYCISRHEKDKRFSFGTAKWSQDAWCWKKTCRIGNADFYFGVPGNDNTIPYHAEKAGYVVKNPCLTFKLYHNHASNIRPTQEFLESIRLDRKFYKEVPPCTV
jgi:hypothetical protein